MVKEEMPKKLSYCFRTTGEESLTAAKGTDDDKEGRHGVEKNRARGIGHGRSG